ncbi:MAG: DUF2069 domain-containing protein [Burkholderiaceae bacterium]
MMSAGEPQATVAPVTVPRPWPLLAAALTLALIAMGLAWELVLDPLRPGGSWLALKVIPLLFGVKGLWQGRIYTFKWMSLLIWIYVGEALVRVMGLSPEERLLAGVSLALSLGLAISILWGARQFFKQRAVRTL